MRNNLTNPPISTGGSSGYAIQVGATSTSTFTDGQSLFFGSPGHSVLTAGSQRRVYMPAAGIISVAYLYGRFANGGSGEEWPLYIRLNNTTDTLVYTHNTTNADKLWSNTGLSITVAAGDYIEMKLINPSWVTNPSSGLLNGVLYIT